MLVGVALLLMGGIGTDDEWTTLLPGFIVAGIGIGLVNPVIADVAVSVVPKEQSGMASGINDTFRQVGIAIGIAAWGAIFLGRGADKVEQVLAGTPGATGDRPRQLVEAISSGNLDTRRGERPGRAARGRGRRGSRGLPVGNERDPHARRDCWPSPARWPRCGWCASATSSASSRSRTSCSHVGDAVPELVSA